MSGEIPGQGPENHQENSPKPFTLEEVTRLAGQVKDMSDDQLDALWERTERVRPTVEDQTLEGELSLLRLRIMNFPMVKYGPMSQEKLEAEIAEHRKDLQRKATEPYTGSDDISQNTTERFEELEKDETEQSRFFAFLTDRIQTGLILFAENGKPARKAMDDSIMLHYRPEEALQRGISETPLLEDTPREPLTEAQTTYLDQLRQRVVLASGHTGFRMPYEASMHKIVRQLNKEPLPPAQPTDFEQQ